MTLLRLCVATFALACAALAATKHPATKHKAHPVAKHAATNAPKAHAASHPTSKGKRTSKSSGKATTRSRRSWQQAPTPDRYREIQQALASKGYFQGEQDGKWGQDSVDALKRFQGDQNLTADGKLGSLSLIALGLGPKRLSAQTTPPAAGDALK
jgi:hypothetical protein